MITGNLVTRLARGAKHRGTNLLWEYLCAETLIPLIVHHLFRRPKRQVPDPATVKKVTVWCIDSAGDSLWITPALRALKEGYAGAAITLVCNQAVRSLFEGNPHVDELVPLDAAPFYGGRGFFTSCPQLKRLARAAPADVMLVLEAGSRPADRGRLFARRARARYCVSTNLGRLKSLPDHTLPPQSAGSPRYWADYYLDAVRHLGLRAPAGRPEIFPGPPDFSRVKAALREWHEQGFPRNRLLLHPGVAAYGRATKQWPRERFRAVARLALGERATHVLVSGSADEMPAARALVEEINQDAGRVLASAIAGDFSLPELAALMPACAALVTGDTSVLHLASAAKLPTVAVFGATDAARLSPPGAQPLSAGLPCQPCHRARDERPFWPRCQFSSARCLEAISAEAVFARLVPLLAPRPAPEARA